MKPRWYHIYVDDKFIETVQSTQEMWVVAQQVKEIHSDYKNKIEVVMMGMGESVTTFRRENC